MPPPKAVAMRKLSSTGIPDSGAKAANTDCAQLNPLLKIAFASSDRFIFLLLLVCPAYPVAEPTRNAITGIQKYHFPAKRNDCYRLFWIMSEVHKISRAENYFCNLDLV
jgi:hypothetical protein